VKCIIVDEISLVKEMHWAAMWHIKKQYGTRFLLVGNFSQHEPVCDRSADFDYENSAVLHELAGGRKLVLDKCRRAAENEKVLFKQYKYLSNDQLHKFNLDLFGQEETDLNICYTNAKIIEVNKKWMRKRRPEKDSKWMLCKTSDTARKIHCQDIICYKNLPVISVVTRQSEGIFNGELWKVIHFDEDEVTLRSDEGNEKRECIIEKDKLACLFRPAYAISSHKCQGKTFDRPFTIHQWNHMGIRAKYVSVSRGRRIGDVNILR
jgi:hypothetical protein